MSYTASDAKQADGDKAFATNKGAAANIAIVRIKCEAGGTAACTVLDCNGQDGTPHFGEPSTMIATDATTILQAAAIGEILDTDAWSGRPSRDVLSDNDLSVQILVRSTTP